MAQPVVHFEIAGKNGEKSRAFYGKLFGWTFDVMKEADYGLVAPGSPGNSIGGGVGSTPPGTPPYLTFYVMVDDLEAYLKKAESMGAKTILLPTPIPNFGASAMFADPDGLVVGLFRPNM
jgi:hypothetical protein